MRDTIEEQWRPIEGYEGYEVSNLGKVKSLKLGNGRILSFAVMKNGYLRVGLCKEGKQKLFLVHRLVAHAFIPNPEGLPIINHKDEDKTNNIVLLKDDGSVDESRSNLEWCTVRYNTNYGTSQERRVQTRISNGTYDPEMCGIGDRKKYHRLNMRKYRLKKKQEKKKDNRPSESLW